MRSSSVDLPKIATADWSAWSSHWTAREGVYITCHRRKGWPRKNIVVCQNCRHQRTCKDLAAAMNPTKGRPQ